ncbi:MAG: hypothetical protein U0232_18965 [Thermomicrobiales bacterium]
MPSIEIAGLSSAAPVALLVTVSAQSGRPSMLSPICSSVASVGYSRAS